MGRTYRAENVRQNGACFRRERHRESNARLEISWTTGPDRSEFENFRSKTPNFRRSSALRRFRFETANVRTALEVDNVSDNG